jgi:hypothetical protein
MTEPRASENLTMEALARGVRADEKDDRSFFAKGPTWANDPQKIARQEAQQGLYLAASGTLTQFNAIVAAILATALASTDFRLLKVTLAVALGLHLIAAFLLCWAARPIESSASVNENTDDTFSNYRRGWRVTLIGVVVSSFAALLFVLGTFGIDITALAK